MSAAALNTLPASLDGGYGSLLKPFVMSLDVLSRALQVGLDTPEERRGVRLEVGRTVIGILDVEKSSPLLIRA